nr:MAG TPA: hypothetical protein [Caudoviricetes sp.]
MFSRFLRTLRLGLISFLRSSSVSLYSPPLKS